MIFLVEFHVGIDVGSRSKRFLWLLGFIGVRRGNFPGVFLHQLSPWQRQVAHDELPQQGVGGVGLLVVTSGGERRKVPLLVTHGNDVTGVRREYLS